MDLGSTGLVQDDLIVRSLVISSKTLFPNKVTVIDSRQTCLLGNIQPTTPRYHPVAFLVPCSVTLAHLCFFCFRAASCEAEVMWTPRLSSSCPYKHQLSEAIQVRRSYPSLNSPELFHDVFLFLLQHPFHFLLALFSLEPTSFLIWDDISR